MYDKNGRAYAKLSELADGTRIELDDGFDCVEHDGSPTYRKVHESAGKQLYFSCRHGRHYLDGQLANDGKHLIGVYKATNGSAYHS